MHPGTKPKTPNFLTEITNPLYDENYPDGKMIKECFQKV